MNLPPEPQKSHKRRETEGFYERYLSGYGLDIGSRTEQGNGDPITQTATAVNLDYPGYDGLTLPFADASQEYVFASHILEHTQNPVVYIREWMRVTKPGRFVVIEVPHQWLYERKATLPSVWNQGHYHFFTPASLLRIVEEALPDFYAYRIESLKDLDEGYDYTLRNSPELHPVGCFSIELVIRKLA